MKSGARVVAAGWTRRLAPSSWGAFLGVNFARSAYGRRGQHSGDGQRGADPGAEQERRQLAAPRLGLQKNVGFDVGRFAKQSPIRLKTPSLAAAFRWPGYSLAQVKRGAGRLRSVESEGHADGEARADGLVVFQHGAGQLAALDDAAGGGAEA